MIHLWEDRDLFYILISESNYMLSIELLGKIDFDERTSFAYVIGI